jgi:hypothetical protein
MSVGLILVVGPVARAFAGQVPGAASTPDVPLSGRDRVYLSHPEKPMEPRKSGATTTAPANRQSPASASGEPLDAALTR